MPWAPKTHIQKLKEAGLYKPVPRQSKAATFRSSTRWKKFRAWHKRTHPLCCDPFGDHKRLGEMPVVAGDLHHILPLNDRPDLALDESNCAQLCRSCHGRIEGMERSGRSTAHLFEGGGAP